MGIPLLGGRFFTQADTANTQLVAIVNHKLAEHCWPGSDPIGKRLRFPDSPISRSSASQNLLPLPGPPNAANFSRHARARKSGTEVSLQDRWQHRARGGSGTSKTPVCRVGRSDRWGSLHPDLLVGSVRPSNSERRAR
jgi:hypothetical protein